MRFRVPRVSNDDSARLKLSRQALGIMTVTDVYVYVMLSILDLK